MGIGGLEGDIQPDGATPGQRASETANPSRGGGAKPRVQPRWIAGLPSQAGSAFPILSTVDPAPPGDRVSCCAYAWRPGQARSGTGGRATGPREGGSMIEWMDQRGTASRWDEKARGL